MKKWNLAALFPGFFMLSQQAIAEPVVLPDSAGSLLP